MISDKEKKQTEKDLKKIRQIYENI